MPRGFPARVPKMEALQGSTLPNIYLGGHFHLLLALPRAVEVSGVCIGSVSLHGHLWRLLFASR